MNEPTPRPAPNPADQRPAQRLLRWLRAGGWRALAGAAAGAGLLATYAHFIGCRTGTCALTADVPTATVVGALVGLVIGWPAPAKADEPAQQPQ
jgi:hypothetical protein